MKTFLARTVIASTLLGAALLPAQSLAQNGPQLRTLSDLGFPDEGYCVDVLGVGDTARADLPLIAHNCLPAFNSSDRIVEIRPDGRLFMPAFDACVTAFAVGQGVLSGAPLMLRPCGGNESFLRAAALQVFEQMPDGQLQVQGTDHCLAVGPDAAPTFDPTHRWRTLTIEACGTLDPSLGQWRF